MQVALIQKQPLADPVLASTGSALLAAGHRAEVFVPAAEPDLARALRHFAPALLVFSPGGGEEGWCLRQAGRLRQATGGAKVAMVGPVASDQPALARHAAVDVVLRGDPESGLPELASAVPDGEAMGRVAGAVVAGRGQDLQEGPAPRTSRDPSAIPLEDIDIYRRYPWVLRLGLLRFAVGRGTGENLHADAAIGPQEFARRFAPARRFSVEDALQRLHLRLRRQPAARRVAFVDDSLLAPRAPRGWLEGLLDRYRREVGLPFSCLARADLLEKRIDLLARAGCKLVKLGIECGDEGLRRRVARTPVSDEQLRETVAELRRAGIRVHAVCLVGLPGESLDQALCTLDLATALKPDRAYALPFRDGTDGGDPAFGRLASVLPLVVRFPRLREFVPGALGRRMDGALAALHQVHHDAASLGSFDLGPMEILHVAARMKAGRGA